MGFGCYPHKDTCDILSEALVSCILQSYSSKNEGVVLRYINKVKYRHGIGLPTTFGYQYCGEKIGFNVTAMFSPYNFSLTGLHNILYHVLAWKNLPFYMFFSN